MSGHPHHAGFNCIPEKFRARYLPLILPGYRSSGASARYKIKIEMKKTIGIIAGNGRFPFLVAREARKEGYSVAVCGVEGEADPELQACSDFFSWVKVGELKKLVKFFRSQGVHEAVMAGKVEKVRLFQKNVHPDLAMMKVLMKT